MDQGIADIINRTDVVKLFAVLDQANPGWFLNNLIDSPFTSLDTQPARDSLTRTFEFAARHAGVTFRFDGSPADDDWEGMQREMERQIVARREKHLAQLARPPM